MCAHVVTQNPMAELNPVSNKESIVESMLQRLQLNSKANSSPRADMQTDGQTGECNAKPLEDSSKGTVFQFGSSTNINEQVWNKWEDPRTQQSSHSIPVAKNPFKRISRHSRNSKTKRPPLIWGEPKDSTSERTDDVTSWAQMPRQQSDDQMSSPDVSPSYETQSFRNPPDLIAPTLKTSSSVLDKSEVEGQSDTAGDEINEGAKSHENPSGNSTKPRKWAKRWAQNVKDRFRERQRSIPNKQCDDGERQAQNEAEYIQSNHSSFSESIDVNNPPMALATDTTEIDHEPINTAPDEDGPSSLNYMSDSLFSLGTTNLMEEIFSGTQWAQFLTGSCTMLDQSNKPPSINQSPEEEFNIKWSHKNSVVEESVQPSLLDSVPQDMTSITPVYIQPETSQMTVSSLHVTDLTANSLNTSDPFTVQSQNANVNLNKPYNSEELNEQSQPDPNESKATEHSDQPMPSQECNDGQEGTEEIIPLLDLSYIKSKRSSITSFGFLSRKREHWTKRRNPFEDMTQDMEDEDHSTYFRAKRSSNSVRSVSPTSSLNSLPDSISEDLGSSASAVKKRKMSDIRQVRFAEEVVILPTSYLPEYNEENDDEEDDDDDKEDKDDNCSEEPSPRPTLPKWIVSLKGRSAKYKF